MNSVARLKYLQACLQEDLRIYPSVPSMGPRVIPPKGETIMGEYVPAGTRVTMSQYTIFRSPQNFHLPESFVPERWLGDKRFANDNFEASKPFGNGPRNCIGEP